MIATLFQDAMAYPTVVWTAGFSLVMLYWLLVAGGALDAHASDQLDFPGEMEETATLPVQSTSPVTATKSRRPTGVLGLREVPFAVWATLIVMVNAVSCRFALRYTGALSTWQGVALLVALLLASLPVTILIVQPLRPLFNKRSTPVDN